MSTQQKGSLLSVTDFLIDFCRGQIPDNGEDCDLYSLHERAALCAALDGCGGSGAKKYPRLQNKTGAYIGSRAAADAMRRWFDGGEPRSSDALHTGIQQALDRCNALVGEKTLLMGRISKIFPTTLASYVLSADGRSLFAELYWIGDSRVYLLNEDGLAQLTEDDLDGIDAMDNLVSDGNMTGVISLSAPYEIHTARVPITKPCFLFAATDGCYGYLPTPMDFEFLLLSTLLQAHSAEQWEQLLIERIGKVAGDDYTLVGLSIGFGGFARLQRALARRTETIYRQFILPLQGKGEPERRRLWALYRANYYRCLCPGEGKLRLN